MIYFFDKSFLQKKVNSEDVYNACDRRNLKMADLERIADNLEEAVTKMGISVIYQMDKLKGEARFTEEFKLFDKIRNTKKAAITCRNSVNITPNLRMNSGNACMMGLSGFGIGCVSK